ncbi:MAG: STAS domain-containing protein [Chitinivibrionales bacterium]|nr:STAS domain-containing protein [Chitinivibrionales bacterium]
MDLIFTSERKNGYTMMNIRGKMTCGTIEVLRKEIYYLIAGGAVHLAFNLNTVTVVDSNAINMFIHFQKLLQPKSGSLYFITVPPRIYSIFKRSRVLQTLPCYSTINEADNNIGIHIAREERGMYCLISPPPIFKVTSLKYVRKTIDDIISTGHRRIAFNLEKVLAIDSSAIGLILNLHKRLQSEGGGISLVNISSEIYPALEATNMLHLIPQYDSIKEADERIA